MDNIDNKIDKIHRIDTVVYVDKLDTQVKIDDIE